MQQSDAIHRQAGCTNKTSNRSQDKDTDCYLRQGAGGTKTACFGSRTCFLRSFHNRYEAYFGQKAEEHIKILKNRNMDVKNDDCFIKMRY